MSVITISGKVVNAAGVALANAYIVANGKLLGRSNSAGLFSVTVYASPTPVKWLIIDANDDALRAWGTNVLDASWSVGNVVLANAQPLPVTDADGEIFKSEAYFYCYSFYSFLTISPNPVNLQA